MLNEDIIFSRVKMMILVAALMSVTAVSQAARPRGVRPELGTMYNPSSDFKCFDASNVIPFSQVNDDYCDCEVNIETIQAMDTFLIRNILIRMVLTSRAPRLVTTASFTARTAATGHCCLCQAGWGTGELRI